MLGMPPREAPNEGMRKCRLKAPPLLLPESPSKGKRGPQRAPRHMPRAGMLAVQECAPLVLRDTAPGLPKQGLPWGIEGEPGGSKIFALKRPFEADNEGDDVGHHRSLPSHIRTPSVPAP